MSDNQEHSTGTYYPMQGNKPSFVYSVRFIGDYPVGAVALVVATSLEEVKSTFMNHLFTENHSLYCKNSSGDSLGIEVFCQADPTQLGKVKILLDGDY